MQPTIYGLTGCPPKCSKFRDTDIPICGNGYTAEFLFADEFGILHAEESTDIKNNYKFKVSNWESYPDNDEVIAQKAYDRTTLGLIEKTTIKITR